MKYEIFPPGIKGTPVFSSRQEYEEHLTKFQDSLKEEFKKQDIARMKSIQKAMITIVS